MPGTHRRENFHLFKIIGRDFLAALLVHDLRDAQLLLYIGILIINSHIHIHEIVAHQAADSGNECSHDSDQSEK